MLNSTTLGRRLGLIATAGLLSVALPASAAWAQKIKDKGTGTAPAAASEPSVAVEIPTIEAVQSSLDDETLRAIFSGNLANNADALAGLDASSITIPEITIAIDATIEGESRSSSVTFSDLVLTDVTDGIAASVTLAGVAMDAGEDGGGEFGTVSAANFNIAGVLGLYGLVAPGTSTELQTIYSDFSFEGGSFEAPEIACTMGGMTIAEFKARPLSYSFADVMGLVQTLDEDSDPSPQAIGDLMRIYADMFTAFETSPSEFGGFECDGIDEDDRPIHFAIAGMTVGGMTGGLYPSVSMNGLDITVEGDGTVQVGNITIKEMDLTGPIAAIQAAPAAIDEAWLAEHARDLIPAFAGFSFDNIVVDVPDPEAEGQRIAASVGTYDLTLDGWFNGVPTDLNTSASNIIIDLPEESSDEQLAQLIALGLDTLDLGFVIDASWNEAEDTIDVSEISFTGADLATAALSGTIVNATEALFSLDENQTLAAAMGVAIRSLKLDLTDAGLSDLVLASVAAEQGGDSETLRPVYAGLAEGTVIGMLAGAAEAQKVGAALNSFISGKARSLTIELTSKEPAGLGMMDFMAAETDPTSLIGKVNIDATAK